VAARVFYNGGVMSFSAARAGHGRAVGREDVFIIHNGQLLPEPEVTRRSVRSIALRAFDSASKWAVVGDLFRIYARSQDERASLQWVTIPEGVDLVGEQVFDPVLMGKLYELGFDIARKGPPWSTAPPSLRQGDAP